MILTVWFVSGESLSAQTLKAITFNIRTSAASREDGDNAWIRRANAVKTMIKTEDPDVMGLQEALLDQLSYIDKSFLRTYRRIGVGRDNGITRGEHMAIYYNTNRLALMWHTTRWLSPTPYNVSRGWDAGCFRTVTIAKFRVLETNKVFYYIDTHLDNVGVESRRESVKLIVRLIKTLTGDVPIVLGGDMNVPSTDPALEPFSQAGLTLARESAPQSDNKPSYNGFGKHRNNTTDEFYIRGIRALSVTTLDNDYGVPYISDHYPIRLIFELP